MAEVRDALLDAIQLDYDQIPAPLRQIFGTPEEIAEHLLARDDVGKQYRAILELASPDADPAKLSSALGLPEEVGRDIQRQMLAGYTSEGWQPSQLNGREPEPYEMSPGAAWLNRRRARQDLIGEVYRDSAPEDQGFLGGLLSLPFHDMAGEQDPLEVAANVYFDRKGWTHAPSWNFKSIENPESMVGGYFTKMGPVLSDAASQLGTALLSDSESRGDAFGDAATRSYASDFNRTSPVLAEEMEPQAAHELIQRMRQARSGSEGMDSADTLRSMTGQKSSGWTRPVEWAMSLGNGLLDGSVLNLGSIPKAAASQLAKSSTPLLQNYGLHAIKHADEVGGFMSRLAPELMEEGATDGTITAGTNAFYGDLYKQRGEESDEDFAQRQAAEAKEREQSMKFMEANNDKIKRPETPTTWAGKKLAPFLAPLMQDSKPVVRPIGTIMH